MACARRILFLCAWITAACVAPSSSGAADNDYPARPVKTIVPFAAGGPADVLARLLSQRLTEAFGGKAFVVENRPGAAGNIGIVQSAKAAPDGYTLLLASTAFVINPSLYANAGFDPIKDFTPITLAASSPNILVVHPDFPARDMREFLSLVRSAPGRYDYATPGVGTGPHLSAELFKMGAKIFLTHIPYNGGGPAIQAVLSGQVPICMSALPATVQQVKAGRLRPMAVTSSVRVPSMPEVPTIAEAGLQDFQGDTLQFIVAPSGTPPAIVDRLYKEIAAALATPDVREKLTSIGFLIVASAPAATARRIALEQEKWARVIKAAGIKPE